MIVKICGVRNAAAAAAAAAAGADLLGFNFWPGTRRYLPPQDASAAIAAARDAGAGLVGVFVNQPLQNVRELADLYRLDYVQLSGDESPEYCARVGRPVIKSIRLARDRAEAAAGYDVAAFLCDAAASGLWGGSGQACDWDAARELARRSPVLLAGGLTPDNVAGAIAAVDPWGVDVASGVETDGGKDPAKIEAFIRAARGAARREQTTS